LNFTALAASASTTQHGPTRGIGLRPQPWRRTRNLPPLLEGEGWGGGPLLAGGGLRRRGEGVLARKETLPPRKNPPNLRHGK